MKILYLYNFVNFEIPENFFLQSQFADSAVSIWMV